MAKQQTPKPVVKKAPKVAPARLKVVADSLKKEAIGNRTIATSYKNDVKYKMIEGHPKTLEASRQAREYDRRANVDSKNSERYSKLLIKKKK